MSDHIKHVSDASFDTDVLKAGTPVLVDYWAEWCGPCKTIAPILDDVAKDYAGRLTVAKLDIDANPGHAGEIWHPRHPHADLVQGRRDRRAKGRRALEVATYRFY